MIKINLCGQIFGRLTVIDLIGVKNGHKSWRCSCSCGVETTSTTGALRHGQKKSCGCLVADTNRAIRQGKPSTQRTHNAGGYNRKRDSEYVAWLSMRQRCSDANRPGYERYGGRGISVCHRWDNSYGSFLEDMGPRPSPLHSIDRKDNDGNYEKSNCRWALPMVQQNNKGNNKRIEVSGQWMNMADLCRIYGIPSSTAFNRIKAMGDNFSIDGLLRSKNSRLAR